MLHELLAAPQQQEATTPVDLAFPATFLLQAPDSHHKIQPKEKVFQQNLTNLTT
jgi:hypothetical protein